MKKNLPLLLLFLVMGFTHAATFGVPVKSSNTNTNIQIIPNTTTTPSSLVDEGAFDEALPELPDKAPKSIAPPPYIYRATVADQTIRATINRWLRDAKMQDVVWKLNEDISVDRDVVFTSIDLRSALTELMKTTTNIEPSRACIYSNDVVEIIPRTLFCE